NIDLRGFFFYPCFKRTFDRAGNLLEESRGTIKSPGNRAVDSATLLTELARAEYVGKTTYSYLPGWLRPQRADSGDEELVYTPGPGANPNDWTVNGAGWREWPTISSNYYILPPTNAGSMAGFFLCRRFDSPRLLNRNRHLPGITNVWEAWTRTELSPTG